jgi:hypothetical protein
MLFFVKYNIIMENNLFNLQPLSLRLRKCAPLDPSYLARMQNLRTRVNSPLARIARLVLKAPRVAMVVGQTVHLSGTSREEFLADAEWVAHEAVHLRQYREHGLLPFLWKYLVESARVGYYHNRFEAEAREEARRVVLADPNHTLRPLPRHAQQP